MTQTPTITIAPLSVPGAMNQAAWRCIQQAGALFLQTVQSPCAQPVLEAGLDFTSMDDLYASAQDFDQLNQAIAQRLCEAGDGAVYAVCGGGMGDAALQALVTAAKAAGLALRQLPGAGFSQCALCALPEPLPLSGMTLCAAYDMPASFDPYHTLCIEDVDTPLTAGDVKLALGEYYPDDYPLWFCVLGQEGYQCRRLTLMELDRQKDYGAGACAILPPAQPSQLSRKGVDDLMAVMARLRGPGGCPWDAEQTHLSLRGSLIEEAYEVLDALEREDDDALCEELGDLLLQIAFHAIIAQEQGAFNLRDVSTGIVDKLVFRHPHVFGSVHVNSSNEVKYNWEQLKRQEKHQATVAQAMEAVPRAFPALMRSAKVQKKAAQVGFDWTDPMDAIKKLPEETGELLEAMEGQDPAAVDEEMGDLLFAAVNVARLLGRDPEALLHKATEKFMARFAAMEARILAEGKDFSNMTLEEMDAYWDNVKAELQKN